MLSLKLSSYLATLPKNSRAILLTCFYALIAGLSVVAFQMLINLFYNATFPRLACQSHLIF